MTWTSYKTCGTGASEAASGTDQAWTNPGNITANDSNYASCTLGDATPDNETDILKATNFGFTTSDVPAGASILGIEFRVWGNVASGYTLSRRRPIKPNGSGGIITDGNLTDSGGFGIVSPDDDVILGGVEEVAWYDDITAADVIDSEFGLAFTIFENNGNTFNINYVECRINYTTTGKRRVTTLANSGIADFSRPLLHPMQIGSDIWICTLSYNNNDIQVYKQTGGSGDFVVQDADGWTRGDSEGCWAAVDDGTDIHAVVMENNGSAYYNKFTVSSGTWGTETTLNSISHTSMEEYYSCDLNVLSNGDIIVAYYTDYDRVMGGDKLRLDYSAYDASATGWTHNNSLDGSTADYHFQSVCLAKSSLDDHTHAFFETTRNTADDPPIIAGWISTVTIDESFATQVTATGAWPSAENWVNANGGLCAFDNAGTWELLAVNHQLISNTNSIIRQWDAFEDGSDFIETGAGSWNLSEDHFGGDADPYHNTGLIKTNRIRITRTANSDGEVLCLWSGGGTGSGSEAGPNKDIYYATTSDEGATWTSSVEHADAVTCEWACPTWLSNGDVGYVWLDGVYGNVWYDTIPLGPQPFLPFFGKKYSVLKRM